VDTLLWQDISSSKDPETKPIGFAKGFALEKAIDLTLVATSLPEGIVLCDSRLVAGPAHIRALLLQAAEYWARGLFLARNKSIDLLMRLSCQSQISQAIEMSNLRRAKSIALLGIVNDPKQIDDAGSEIMRLGGKPSDSGLFLTKKKEKFLRNLHGLPDAITSDQLPLMLAEKSVLLIFDK
jgi:tRNA threonylcarbamoyladenosine modification (KEOPS) complex Cgi121 subunit